MGQICVMHGVVDTFDAAKATHRGLFDRQAFVDYLTQRPARFVPLATALNGHGAGHGERAGDAGTQGHGGDALTIDDATVASAEAASIARGLGHAVTVFVNANYVAHAREHYFYVLNTLLDRVSGPSASWEGTTYDVTRPLHRAALRRALKQHLQGLADDDRRLDALREWGARFGVADVSVPPYLRTLTRDDVASLIAQGVDIQNHGWTHADMASLSVRAQRDEVVRGREWLESTFDIRVEAYAVPFGVPQPEPALRKTLRETWLCANDRWTSGQLAPGVWNRMSLNLFGSSWKARA